MPISTKLDRKHAWGMWIQISSNNGTGVINGPALYILNINLLLVNR